MNNNSSLINWIKEEFTDISFNDNRLKKRFAKVAQGLAEKSEKNISSSFETWSEIKGCYRFFDNEKVTCSRILQPHRERTLKRIREHKRVLFIQDTVVLSYKNRVAYVKSWIKVLKEDKKAIFRASSLAQKATEFILNLNKKA